MMKIVRILPSLLLALMLQTSSCYQQENVPMVKWKGPNEVNDLVFVFKEGTTYEQKVIFEQAVLYKSRADGRGQDQQDGVEDTTIGNIKGDYVGGTVNFSKKATNEQRENLKKAIESSPIVYRVYENVIPNQINDLN